MGILEVLASWVLAGLTAVGLLGSPLGTGLPAVPAQADFFLAEPVAKADTSLTLSSATLRSGESVSGYLCFTLAAGTAQVEYVCGNASGTTVSALERGLSLVDGVSTSSARAFAHRRFTAVQVTDFPGIERQKRLLTGTDAFTSPLSYSTTTPGFITSDAELAHKGYVDSVAFFGAPDASSTSKGIVEIATSAEIASGTSVGTTSAPLVPNASDFGANATTTTMVPVTGSDGKLDQGFLDLTEPFVFTELQSASSTFATTTFTSIPSLPSSTPSGANDAVRKQYVDDRSGGLAVAQSSSTSANLSAGATSTIRTAVLPSLGPMDGFDIQWEVEALANNTTYNLVLSAGEATSTLWTYLDTAQRQFHGHATVLNRGSTSSQYNFAFALDGASTSSNVGFRVGTSTLELGSTTSTLSLYAVSAGTPTVTSQFLIVRKMLAN